MIDFDRDWDRLPLDELQQLDALCVRFERALAENLETRIEPFLVGLDHRQQKLVVAELVRLEIELRSAHGQRPMPDEFARRFPQWADELRELQRPTTAEAATDTVDSDRDHLAPSGERKARRPWGKRAGDALRASWADLPAGEMLKHYRILGVIGQGGMGAVARAHDCQLGRDVAIKFLPPGLTHDANVRERFLREARAIASIRHDNVTTIYSVEQADQVPFLVMELVAGTTLEEYLRTRGKLTAGETIGLAYQVAQGLAAAHKKGVIHRDVKPANILLEPVDQDESGSRPLSTWRVKITDFGLARVTTEAGLTIPGVIAGTPQYMSPEQAEAGETDGRSDLFSLGSVLYTMCAGRPPFEADSAVAILRQVADQPARALRDISPETPEWLDAIIVKLMAKSPDQRFQTAAEVVDLFGRLLHDHASRKEGNVGRAASERTAAKHEAFRWSKRLHLPTAALVALAIAVGVYMGIMSPDRNSSPDADALQGIPQVEVARLLPNDGLAGAQFGSSISISGDTAVIGACYDDHAGKACGAAYVFGRVGADWVQQARLTASDAEPGDFFGFSVFLKEDTLLVSSPGKNGGVVYAYTRSGTTWLEQAKLTADDGAVGDDFGKQMALDGDTLIVGAPGAKVGPVSSSGAAYVFVRSDATWSQQAKLVASDRGWQDYFGYRVAIDGDTVVIGAWQADNRFTDSGAAYVFTRNDTTWTEQARLTASDPTNVDGGDVFGHSVSIHEDTIVVGASACDGAFTNSGAAYVFTRQGTTWSQQAKLTPSDGQAFDSFGSHVFLCGDTLLVSSELSDARAGAVYVFTGQGKTWKERSKLTASARATGDLFGTICYDGDVAMIGAPGADDHGEGSGAVYVFSPKRDP